jgi:palmitoyltransferase
MLAIVMALAIGIMCDFHLWTVVHSKTTVDSQDHDTYRRMAKAWNEVHPVSYLNR